MIANVQNSKNAGGKNEPFKSRLYPTWLISVFISTHILWVKKHSNDRRQVPGIEITQVPVLVVARSIRTLNCRWLKRNKFGAK